MSIRHKAKRTNQGADNSDKSSAMRVTSRDNMAISSSLDSIHISPRTPKTPRNAQDGDDVELSLLGEQERREFGFNEIEEDHGSMEEKRKISAKDKRGMVLLCILCKFGRCYLPPGRLITFVTDLIQGVPVRF